MHSIFRLIPYSLRIPLFYRLYASHAANRPQLFEAAPLALVPGVYMSLMPSDCGHQIIAYTGIYEWQVSSRMAALARSGGCLLDVGANAGYFSLLWCGLHKSNTVEAFEALPANVARLRRNIETNGMNNQIRVNDFAIGKTDGMVPFETGPSDQTGWGGIAVGRGSTTIEVAVRRLDSVFKQNTGPVTLKTDCEGADAWVMEGAQEILSGHLVRNVFFEVNKERQDMLGIPHDASQVILQKCGFHCEQIGVNDWHSFKE